MSEYGSSKNLSGGLKLFAIFSMFTGTVDLIVGHKLIIPASERSLLPSPTLAFVDNQLRFLGAIWSGYGMILWWASSNLETRKVPLSLLGTAMFLAGVGRLTSGLSLGWGAPWLKIAAAAELIAPPLIYLFGF
ncbi:uncharacterized protein BKA55DRAFT_672672 [Fusarium redolens]|uniref:DUF4345 domain-containing protein n=1 Tax=Fusarium redolens TaxID=48865 RepID=A0A9P9KKV9_FUSRE|nr:uncharacterized protein BKA55DRAFT_672672 [Fusarium redolens]KAH7260831.1 hypothetical protein BKA55DRAFT_672672 [Fusarium redolens]